MNDDNIKFWPGIGFGVITHKRKTEGGDRFDIHYIILPFIRIRI